MNRNYSRIDRVITSLDEALRISTGAAPTAERENPAGDLPPASLDRGERRHVAGLMRINHTGEVCAQALYAGQAATARHDETREAMQQAAAGGDVSAQLDEIHAALVTDQTISSYPQPMLQAQLQYLYSGLQRADQKPGRDSYERLETLEAELAAHKARLERLLRTITEDGAGM